MHPDLEKLLELQTKDLALLETDVRLKALGEEIAALDAAMERAREDAETAKPRLEEGAKKREALEKGTEGQRAQQEKRRDRRAQQEKRRVRVEQVRPAGEVQALMTEMDLARSTVARSESDWVKASDLTSQQEGAVKEAEERMGGVGGGEAGG